MGINDILADLHDPAAEAVAPSVQPKSVSAPPGTGLKIKFRVAPHNYEYLEVEMEGTLQEAAERYKALKGLVEVSETPSPIQQQPQPFRPTAQVAYQPAQFVPAPQATTYRQPAGVSKPFAKQVGPTDKQPSPAQKRILVEKLGWAPDQYGNFDPMWKEAIDKHFENLKR